MRYRFMVEIIGGKVCTFTGAEQHRMKTVIQHHSSSVSSSSSTTTTATTMAKCWVIFCIKCVWVVGEWVVVWVVVVWVSGGCLAFGRPDPTDQSSE